MNILITSVGRRSYMIEYFKESVGKNGKIHAANSDLTYALQTADHYLLTPPIYDNSYIGTLINYCKEHNISSIISLFDIDLPILSRNKEAFNEIGVQVIVSDPEIVSICNDKWKTYKFLTENNLKSPRTFISLEAAREAITAGEVVFPVFIKPRWGMGSIGIFEAENEIELDVFYQKTKNIIRNTYLRFEAEGSMEKSVIIQEKIEGKEFGLDIFNDLNGDHLTSVPKQKIAMRAGETDIAKVIVDTKLINFGKKISGYTRHIGNLDLDFFITDDNQYYILELNCRFGGQYPFSHLAGVNFPKAIVALLSGRKVRSSNLKFCKSLGYKDFVIRHLTSRQRETALD